VADREITAHGVTPLEQRLARRIALVGPLTVADYMTEVLSHPQHGYYRVQAPIGAAGDFVTAPEVSQMFGELIGLWCVEVWHAQGAPDPIRLVELGPGRGTLMTDALRAARLVPAFSAAARIHLVEINPVLREQQRQALGAQGEIAWHDRLQDVPEGPTLLIANEFFDALPIRQFVRRATTWRERLIGLDKDGELVWALSRPLPEGLLEADQPQTDGTVVEVAPQAATLVREIARRVSTRGGAALIIDYGYDGTGPGNTLQAVRHHRAHDVLEAPGTADLSAHVDFAALARAVAAARAVAHGPVTQGDFLRRLGIEVRARRLADSHPDRRAAIAAALQRLIAPEQMGTLFKALAVTAAQAPTPPGFERND
jgi:NADH dehydrogenase [ubiquinone] 1 alpha subcomplex assembly factor 7